MMRREGGVGDTRWLVLGGWGCPARALRPLFGDQARYVDSAPLTVSLTDNDRLAPDWPARLARALERHLPAAPFSIAGWSAGALIAYAVASHIGCQRIALFSATLQFRRTPSWRAGMPRALVTGMIRDMQRDPAATLDSFYRNAALPFAPDPDAFDHAALVAGLRFLREVSLLEYPPPAAPLAACHGADDRIIPAAAGAALARRLDADFAVLPGGHGFLFEHTAALRRRLDALCDAHR
jgi:pimeloyl-ACP methyl ester carboxylesterase